MAKAKREPRPGEALLRSQLRYQMGDANVIDTYLFTAKAGKSLRVHYNGGTGTGDLTFTEAALQSATGHIVLSQGQVHSRSGRPALPKRITTELPPFLLSRAAMAALKKDGSATFRFEWSDEVTEVFLRRRWGIEVKINGKGEPVRTLHCFGDRYNCELWVLDDDTWPVILEHTEGEDRFYFWKLLEAGSNL